MSKLRPLGLGCVVVLIVCWLAAISIIIMAVTS